MPSHGGCALAARRLRLNRRCVAAPNGSRELQTPMQRELNGEGRGEIPFARLRGSGQRQSPCHSGRLHDDAQGAASNMHRMQRCVATCDNVFSATGSGGGARLVTQVFDACTVLRAVVFRPQLRVPVTRRRHRLAVYSTVTWHWAGLHRNAEAEATFGLRGTAVERTERD